ncbi:MAG: hypothetical protein P8M12_02295 [Flavobacteriales bacterium]|nr:hypothetical protein [Flavobacteriales bacterium]
MTFSFILSIGLFLSLHLDLSRQLIKSVYYGESKYCFEVISQTFNNSYHKPDLKIKIEIAPKDFETLNKHRNSAYLKNSINKQEKESVFVLLNDSIKGKIRLKGNKNDHRIENEESYKINLAKGLTIMGCEEFCLLKPERRGAVSEFFMHKLLKREGFITIEYKFINLQLNDHAVSTYSIEEGFNDTLLVKNNREVGPIVKLDDDQFFSEKTNMAKKEYPSKADINCTNKKGKTAIEIETAKTLLADFCNYKKSASEVFDVDKMGSYFAIMDLLGNTHSIIWYNIRFYYDNIRGLLEPIGYDGNVHDNIQSTLYAKWQLKTYPLASHVWIDNFFQDPKFVEAYFNALKRISASGYLESFVEKNKRELISYTQIIQTDNRYYLFYDYKYFVNRDLIVRELKKFGKHENF